MQDLHVLAVENGALLAVSEDGERFRIPVDGVLQSKLREAQPPSDSSQRLSPREIQARIRSGLSAEEVAEATGVSLEHVRRYEGPVVAEREFVVTSALAVPVRIAVDSSSDASTFGEVINERLESANATGVEWAAWKDQDGAWTVRLLFSADRVDHDARWTFDPKKQALSPSNAEAVTLSQQGEAAGVLIPRLRAVGIFDRPTDTSRFDSGAFVVDEEITTAATDIEDEVEDDTEVPPHSQTADLLEALRRRRGERETASYADEPHPASHHPSTGIRLVDVPLDGFAEADLEPEVEPEPRAQNAQSWTASLPTLDRSATTAPTTDRSASTHPASTQTTGSQPTTRSRRNRVSMPSWDDIVFGTRPDDDLA